MSEWQPIDTAPKDGSWILLSGGRVDEAHENPNYPAVQPCVVGQWTHHRIGKHLPDGRWQYAWYDGGYYGEYMRPTHWMPVPDPPGEGA